MAAAPRKRSKIRIGEEEWQFWDGDSGMGGAAMMMGMEGWDDEEDEDAVEEEEEYEAERPASRSSSSSSSSSSSRAAAAADRPRALGRRRFAREEEEEGEGTLYNRDRRVMRMGEDERAYYDRLNAYKSDLFGDKEREREEGAAKAPVAAVPAASPATAAAAAGMDDPEAAAAALLAAGLEGAAVMPDYSSVSPRASPSAAVAAAAVTVSPFTIPGAASLPPQHREQYSQKAAARRSLAALQAASSSSALGEGAEGDGEKEPLEAFSAAWYAGEMQRRNDEGACVRACVWTLWCVLHSWQHPLTHNPIRRTPQNDRQALPGALLLGPHPEGWRRPPVPRLLRPGPAGVHVRRGPLLGALAPAGPCILHMHVDLCRRRPRLRALTRVYNNTTTTTTGDARGGRDPGPLPRGPGLGRAPPQPLKTLPPGAFAFAALHMNIYT
jgi:hypothetical protein